jgi:hypothetical protein
MAASRPRIRDRVAFVFAYAAYASMWSLARDIASATRARDGVREPWAVDPLTRKVYVHSMTALLEPAEAKRLRTALADPGAPPEGRDLSADGRAVASVLTRVPFGDAEAALQHLPGRMRERLDAMSPVRSLAEIHAPLIVLLHDRDDGVIPVSESRRLRAALAGRDGVHYTEFTVFRHLDPTTGKPSPVALAGELVKFGRAVYPLFRCAT